MQKKLLIEMNVLDLLCEIVEDKRIVCGLLFLKGAVVEIYFEKIEEKFGDVMWMILIFVPILNV